jgi:hypothetical protein
MWRTTVLILCAGMLGTLSIGGALLCFEAQMTDAPVTAVVTDADASQ